MDLAAGELMSQPVASTQHFGFGREKTKLTITTRVIVYVSDRIPSFAYRVVVL